MSELPSVTYKCWKCEKEFTLEEGLESFIKAEEREGYTFLRCPYCGFRIIVKARRPSPKRVRAV
ncbi:MAG: DNA-directed RNA polymerase subunit P [Zestosphaera sp.]